MLRVPMAAIRISDVVGGGRAPDVRSNTAPGVVPLPIYRCGGEGPRALRPVGCVGGSDQLDEDRDIGCAAEMLELPRGSAGERGVVEVTDCSQAAGRICLLVWCELQT
jgi:hypothetical protein